MVGVCAGCVCGVFCGCCVCECVGVECGFGGVFGVCVFMWCVVCVCGCVYGVCVVCLCDVCVVCV